ncbi:MAG: winged helix-turn-helix domain-containing protein [Geminicoccaceae bacterium]
MAVRVTLRLDFADGSRLGHGKIQLLEQIVRLGSITAAGKALGMSYKRAWELVDSVNGAFTEPVIVTQHGGSQGGGARLTPFGTSLVERFRRMEQQAAQNAERDLAEIEALLRPEPEAAPPSPRRPAHAASSRTVTKRKAPAAPRS